MNNEEYYTHENEIIDSFPYNKKLPKENTNMDKLLKLLPKKPYCISNENLLRLLPISSLRLLIAFGRKNGWIKVYRTSGKAYYQLIECEENHV